MNLRFTTDISGFSAVYQRIAGHALQPLVNTTEGILAAFQFSKAEVDQVLAESSRRPGLKAQEVARMTGWKEQSVTQWCKQGLIQHDEFPHAGKIGRVIGREALCRFQTEYVPVSVLAAQLGFPSLCHGQALTSGRRDCRSLSGERSMAGLRRSPAEHSCFWRWIAEFT